MPPPSSNFTRAPATCHGQGRLCPPLWTSGPTSAPTQAIHPLPPSTHRALSTPGGAALWERQGLPHPECLSLRLRECRMAPCQLPGWLPTLLSHQVTPGEPAPRPPPNFNYSKHQVTVPGANSSIASCSTIISALNLDPSVISRGWGRRQRRKGGSSEDSTRGGEAAAGASLAQN